MGVEGHVLVQLALKVAGEAAAGEGQGCIWVLRTEVGRERTLCVMTWPANQTQVSSGQVLDHPAPHTPHSSLYLVCLYPVAPPH